ncbi:MAG: hypothetical protein JO197_15225 [Acidobacteria bacterium]|nr:hypothetical protein [Acidobacteriota bacterium]MBV9475126.1 hypothetical protein [Acidobacteriota bacterium]
MRNPAAVLALAALSCTATTTPQPSPATAVPAETTPVATTTTTSTTTTPAPSAPEVDHEGDSPQSAVAVPKDAPDGGVRFENEWIYGRFGRFRRHGGGTGVLENRRYDIVDVELADGTRHKVYFDITENWNAWQPPQ